MLHALHTGDKACVRYTCLEDFPRKHNLKNQPLSQPHTMHHVHTLINEWLYDK